MVHKVGIKDPSSVAIIERVNYIDRKPATPLKGVTIMVNPGHGCIKVDPKTHREYIDSGTTGKIGKKTIFEKDLNDEVAMDVKRKLELLGAKVIYVDNVPIGQIRDLENQYKPDLFIAIHHDALTKKSSGETVYAHGEKSLALGKEINKFLAADKTIPNKPTTPSIQDWSSTRTVLTADSSIPAVLTEIGYMSNPKELKILNTHEYQDKAAQCIVEGVKKFVQKTKKHPAQKVKIPAWDLVRQLAKKTQFSPLTFIKPEKDI